MNRQTKKPGFFLKRWIQSYSDFWRVNILERSKINKIKYQYIWKSESDSFWLISVMDGFSIDPWVWGISLTSWQIVIVNCFVVHLDSPTSLESKAIDTTSSARTLNLVYKIQQDF